MFLRMENYWQCNDELIRPTLSQKQQPSGGSRHRDMSVPNKLEGCNGKLDRLAEPKACTGESRELKPTTAPIVELDAT